MSRAASVIVFVTLLTCAHVPAAPPEPANVALNVGSKVFTLKELQTLAPAVSWRAFDPYYGKPKGWWAMPLAPVLEAGLGDALHADDVEVQLTALDGYQVVLPVSKALEAGAYLAFADLDGPFEPIGPQRANPGPFYLVWKGVEQQHLVTHPRPWSLVKISVVRFDEVYPRTIPPRRDARIDEGQSIFRSQCLRCHALNRQGGHVGPELNVPRNVTEYRELEQLKAFVKNPLAFRYGNMPPFKHLTDSQLDAVFAYLSVMREKKLDDEPPSSH